ncbi:aldose epimerase family protein [Saccharicrinis sp. FJH62]|uniref:aldose epimerase family protein n=1 Tax=Saccharicrinis sp. FJH62 TaxID=3344657 RepID=UPI0035D51F67
MKILEESLFKGTWEDKETRLITLKNKNGMVVQVSNFGGKIVSIYAPDRNGEFADVVLGYDSIDGYFKGHEYFGAICGRYANRISKGKFTLDGKSYQLPINNGPNSLHGGLEGYSMKVFDCEPVKELNNGSSVKMSYSDPDGKMGYPGNVEFSVTYTLTDNNELKLDYEATTDQATPINIAGHSYFNLAGEGNGSIEGHELMINASHFTPMDDVSIPTGEIKPVKGTPMDFTSFKVIGSRINEDDEQLKFGKGYDHNWVIDKKENEPGLAADYYEKASGRGMKVYTTQPGVQFYSANWTDEQGTGKHGHTYGERHALCLETQHFPDSPNKANFPSVILRPGETYLHSCVYKFYTK